MLCLSKHSFRIQTLRNPLSLATSIRAFYRSSTIMSQLITSIAPSPSALNKPIHPSSSSTSSTTTLETLTFDNRAIATLPIDQEKQNFIRDAVPDACFSLVEPTPVTNPVLVAASLPALNLIDIDEKQVEREEFVQYFSGNRLLPGSRPAAHCYCGHQFGYFSGQLGDGAAMYLGEVINSKGERWEIQLKGAGPTPYSRAADGRKVLRSSIREFLASEHMWALGIPTTRAGCVITSDSRVTRDIFYTGDEIQERCSIVLRIAQTFLRFGSFEIFKPTDAETGRAGPSVGRTDILTTMLDYTIETFYPSVWSQYMDDSEGRYLAFYREITLRTARLVAGWQCIGFMHGVLNTDNMSIVGVTIDYGPYGWMEHFDGDTICNTSDDGGRYTYRKQPEICRWNIEKLGEAIQEALSLEKGKKILEEYDHEYQRVYQTTMRHKLGLIFSPHDDSDLITSLFSTFQSTGADFTNTFRSFNRIRCAADMDENKDAASASASPSVIELNHDVIESIVSSCTSVEYLTKKLKPKIAPQQLQRIIQLMQHDPIMLHRMGINPMMIMSEMEKYEKLSELQGLTQDKKHEQDRRAWEIWITTYVERLQTDTIIGQQQHQQQHTEHTIQQVKEHVRMQRIDRQNAHNPKYVLRNWMAQVAIDRAETGDYSEVRKLLELLLHPYTDQNESHVTHLDTKTVEKFNGKKIMCTYDTTPEWGGEICVSCSS